MSTRTAALNALALDDSLDAPEWLCLVPAGRVVGRDGRYWINDQPQAVLDSFDQGQMDLPVDMEHATELKGPQGEPAPAVGWIKDLENRDGQIWGRVEWNKTGRNAVAKKAYRYVSPVIVFDRQSNRVVALSSVALTNRPNLFLQALNGQEKSMDVTKLLAALGLPETATMAEILDAIARLKGQADQAQARNAAEQPPLDRFVPRADYDAAMNRASSVEAEIKAMRQTARKQAIDEAIQQALAQGKITPATVDYHTAQCSQDGGLERFAEFCKAAPVIGDASGLDGKKPDQDQALNATERQVAAMFGNSVEDLRKYAKED